MQLGLVFFFPSILHFGCLGFFTLNLIFLLWFFFHPEFDFFYYPTTQNCDINDIAPSSQVRNRRMKILQGFQKGRGQKIGQPHPHFPQCEKALFFSSSFDVPVHPQCLRGSTQKQPFPFASSSGSMYTKGKKIPPVNTGVEDEIWETLKMEGQPNKSLKCQKLVPRRGVYGLNTKMFKSTCQSS